MTKVDYVNNNIQHMVRLALLMETILLCGAEGLTSSAEIFISPDFQFHMARVTRMGLLKYSMARVIGSSPSEIQKFGGAAQMCRLYICSRSNEVLAQRIAKGHAE